MSRFLSEEKVASALRKSRLDWLRILYAEEMPSTNLVAKQAAVNGLLGDTLVICASQTAGRGRMQRQWLSAEDEALTFSLLFSSRLSPERMHLYTLAASVAVCRAIHALFPELHPGIKWPNDVVLQGRKCCGILCEVACGGQLVLGIGINVNQKRFPDEISEKATSLLIQTGRAEEINPILLLTSVLNQFQYVCEVLRNEPSDFFLEYRCASVTVGKKIKVESPAESFLAEAIDIDENGCLLVKKENGEETAVQCGDVSVRGIMGYC